MDKVVLYKLFSTVKSNRLQIIFWCSRTIVLLNTDIWEEWSVVDPPLPLPRQYLELHNFSSSGGAFELSEI